MSLIQGIIDTAPLPRLTALVQSTVVPIALTNPYSGSGGLPAVFAGQPAYGLIWGVTTFPPSAGSALRNITIFQSEWLALTRIYQTADANSLVGETELIRANSGVLLFDSGQPLQVDYSILAGWECAFAWLVAP